MEHIDIFVSGKKAENDSVRNLFMPEGEITVFESLQNVYGKIFRLEQHLDRLFESAKTCGFTLPKTRGQLRAEIKKRAAEYADDIFFMRLGVDHQNSYLFVTKRKRPSIIYDEGVKLRTAVTRRNYENAVSPQAKASDFFNNVLAQIDSKGDAFDVLFLDAQGYLSESTIWNYFIVKAGILLTPSIGILNGVTRQFVIECAHKERLPVTETFLTRYDFWNADEAFLTNTSGGIVPVSELDGRKVGAQVPGKITIQLRARFQKEMMKELEKDEN